MGARDVALCGRDNGALDVGIGFADGAGLCNTSVLVDVLGEDVFNREDVLAFAVPQFMIRARTRGTVAGAHDEIGSSSALGGHPPALFCAGNSLVLGDKQAALGADIWGFGCGHGQSPIT